ncbi:uncharacterized protein [Nicotiana sylvestris]|uniref:uncharacterized protein n=1 Tax=Nicotiana sylvestris TaxID=4096 RepID=UPI00388C6A84
MAYKDLCLFLNVQLPAGFKIPKFDLYNGHGDPHWNGIRQDHGRWYTWYDPAQAFACHFQYNLEIILDRLSLNKLEKKHSESFREYGFRWREKAARVDPPMKESEMVDYFLLALEPSYYGHLVSTMEKLFNEVVKMGGKVEEGLKSNKIMNYSAVKATTQAIQGGIGGIGKKKREDTTMGKLRKQSQTVMMIRSKTFEQSAGEKLVLKSSKKSVEPSLAVEKGSSSKVATKQEGIKVIVPGAVSQPVIIVEGACADRVIIKLVTQLPIINSKVVPWNYERVVVTYKGKEVIEEVCEAHGLTRSGRCFVPEELRKAKIPKDNPVLVKKAVTEEEAEEFLRKMKMQNYSVVEQLRKAPAQISLLSLLIHLDEHRRSLMKIMNEAYVPDKTSINHLEKIANKIFEVNRVTFFDDELLVEGTEHNRALYLTVKCEDSMVTRVLVDNGSSANI